jgi:hypothetical protein
MNKRAAPTQESPRGPRTAGRYRKVEVRTWGDEKFRALSPMPPCGQGLWLYLITGPRTGPIPGLFCAGPAAMAEDLGWPLDAFRHAMTEAITLGMVRVDEMARVVLIPKAIQHNPPAAPNQVKTWGAEFDLIPECDLKRDAYELLKASIHALGDGFGHAFDAAWRKPSPKPSGMPSVMPSVMPRAIQEQEQEQEYSVAKATGPASPEPPASPPFTLPPEAAKRETMTPKERVWAIGAAVIGSDAASRKKIGKLAGGFGDALAAEALAKAALDPPANPMGWCTAYCEAKRTESPATNGSHRRRDEPVDILADPRPDWALGAGFPNRFEAENEGCLRHNAHLFRDGKRLPDTH